MSRLSSAYTELRRVLIWDIHYMLHPPEVDLFDVLPYPHFFRSKGTMPNDKIIEGCGAKAFVVRKMILDSKNRVFNSIQHHYSRGLVHRGVSLKYYQLESFLRENVIVKSDKDGLAVLMPLKVYIKEAEVHMNSTIGGRNVYNFLGKDEATKSYWKVRSNLWQAHLHALMLSMLSGRLLEIFSSYLACQASSVLGVFYLLCKTHKSTTICQGRWNGRPVVGLPTCATTTASVVLGVAGTILLKLDRTYDEMSTPLRDSCDLVSRVHTLSQVHNWNDYAVTSFDFHSMYTNVTWMNVHDAFAFYKGWFESTPELTQDLTDGEISLLRFLFSPLGSERWETHCVHFPFLSIEYTESLTIGELLLNVVYTHCIFENPGVGIFQQLTGWAMGTNAAPTWSTLVLRFYERLKLHLHPSIKLMRFINDGLMFHPKNMGPSLDSLLKSIYASNLTFDILQRGVVAHVPFLDVLFITLHPLRHSVYWKPTHSALYIPWHSNTPRSVKEGWVGGGCIRFLRLCSHESYYKISWERLRGAIIRWGYPPSLTTKPKFSWNDKPKYINPKSHEKKRSRIHAFRAPHHSAIPISFSRVLRGFVNNLSFLPDVQLFATLQPPPNLGKLFHGWRMRALRKACAPDI